MESRHHLTKFLSGAILTLAIAASSFAQAEKAKDSPIRVYVLVGQSNMQGKGAVEGEGSNSLRYAVNNDPKKEFRFLVGEGGKWRVRSDVWIHYDLHPFRELRYGPLKPGYGSSSGQIGPELGFGHVMGDVKHSYALLLKMSSSEQQKLIAACNTSVAEVTSYRSTKGVVLDWKARGRYNGFQILRDGKVIADGIAGTRRSYLDKQAPAKGVVRYSIEPITGEATPATLSVNLGPADPGDALVYEPFNYPSDADEPQSLIGRSGAIGTRGEYYYLSDMKLERAPAAIGGGLSYGDLPVTGNRGSSHRWSPGCAIALDGSMNKARLLEDGATLWISYVFYVTKDIEHRQGGGTVLLCTEDLKEGVGFQTGTGEYRTAVLIDGKLKPVRITSARSGTPTLVVGKIVWGKDGENDSFVPYITGTDLKLPEKHGRASVPFNIDQSKLSLLVLQGEGQFDEIRVGPTYESVIGGGTKSK